MKVAIISSGNPNNLKGIMNYVQEKCRLMKKRENEDFSVDIYLVRTKNSFWLSLISRIFKRQEIVAKNVLRQSSEESIDEIVYKCLWINYGILKNVFSTKIFKRYVSRRDSFKFAKNFSNYDILVTHTLVCHNIALDIYQKYKTPYIPTWHGSDIAVIPFQKPAFKSIVKQILDNAAVNLFVSNALLNIASQFSSSSKKDVIYTGPSEMFYKYPDETRRRLRQNYGVIEKKVVLYVGNLVPVKNVMLLPPIFEKINNTFKNGKVEFWIIGDGPLKEDLNNALLESNVSYKMFGNMKPTMMPDIMNCADLLFLISKSEGLGLVNLEALSCGCNALGSRIGGIPEILGDRNTFELNDSFIENISQRAIDILVNNEVPLPLSEKFSWSSAIDKEINYYRKIVGQFKD